MTPDLETYLFPLTAEGACPAGTLDLELASGQMIWSDGLYKIHGFHPGQVVPTLDLLMAHQHADDRGPFQQLLRSLADTGRQIALLHRIIDSRGRQRQVFSSLHATLDESGRPEHAAGFMVDLTRTMHEETRQAADEAIQGALAHKAVIEQAKGILRGLFLISAEEAFEILAAQSQHTNTKLHTVAATFIEAMDNGRATHLLNDWKTGHLQP
ncbi:PAS and ANTAR domain-containing protein [Pseudarthrobacter sp. lyk4-40-TYG-27]|uniref:PAS and ANTAR domain-containing protein n=1 Tax=Pseudarthrobacter sp. lyk4-40-TYG-27 TaxID=3040305 RepID=UPI002552B8E2|nr:PAS and ANTAR domain-containing protein [Pseudarthrobacter sp. lyk4-40-TYG-27]